MNQEYLKGIHSEMCSRETIIFQATENNIISFLKNSLFAERSEIRTLDGKRFLTTIKGNWIDICPDRIYLEEKLKPLILAVKEGRKMLLPLKQIKVEQLEGYRDVYKRQPLPGFPLISQWYASGQRSNQSPRPRKTGRGGPIRLRRTLPSACWWPLQCRGRPAPSSQPRLCRMGIPPDIPWPFPTVPW